MSEDKVLVAGVGNVLRGDDAFGVFATRELEQRRLPQEVCVTNFGVRSRDLGSEIKNGYSAVILVEAAYNGGQPGTIYVFDPEVEPVEAGQAIFGSRCMTPEDTLHVLDALDGFDGQIYILSCEPESFESVDTLSAPVESALPEAVSVLENLLSDILNRDVPDASRRHATFDVYGRMDPVVHA